MNRTRLLLVHPETSGLALLTSMLRPLGLELIEAMSHEIADLMNQSRPGLILIGVDPAEPDALGLLSFIRHNYPTIPVVLLFTRTCPERISQALRSGATSVLRFPLPASQLQAAVIQALDATLAHTLPAVGSPDHDSPVQHERRPERRPEGIGDSSPCHCSSHARPVEQRNSEAAGAGDLIKPLKESLGTQERLLILQALRACGWDRNKTSKALDINRSTLYYKMRRYGLHLEDNDCHQTRPARY
jgi:DNA-binding NtrC family response regulator